MHIQSFAPSSVSLPRLSVPSSPLSAIYLDSLSTPNPHTHTSFTMGKNDSFSEGKAPLSTDHCPCRLAAASRVTYRTPTAVERVGMVSVASAHDSDHLPLSPPARSARWRFATWLATRSMCSACGHSSVSRRQRLSAAYTGCKLQSRPAAQPCWRRRRLAKLRRARESPSAGRKD